MTSNQPEVTPVVLRPTMVWRQDGRIRRADGMGYGDMVRDEDIWTHLAGHVEKRDADLAAFCASVLLMRTIEREERDSPQAVTYQEAILDGADPMEGFYDD